MRSLLVAGEAQPLFFDVPAVIHLFNLLRSAVTHSGVDWWWHFQSKLGSSRGINNFCRENISEQRGCTNYAIVNDELVWRCTRRHLGSLLSASEERLREQV